MAQYNSVKFMTGIAAEDLSSDSYKILKVNTSGKYVKCTATTDVPAGILYPQGQMVTDEPIKIAKSGSSKIALGATLTPDDIISTTTGAIAQAAVATHYPIGQLLKGGASGEIGIVDLNIGLTPLA